MYIWCPKNWNLTLFKLSNLVKLYLNALELSIEPSSWVNKHSDCPPRPMSPPAYSDLESPSSTGWFRRSLEPLARCQPAINLSPVTTNITNIPRVRSHKQISWRQQCHPCWVTRLGNIRIMGTLLRSRHLTPCECGQCPPGGTDLSTPICICTNIGKCSFSDIYALCQWKRMLIKGTVYFIELGKHWHPSFPMENIVVFCSHCSSLLV